MSHDDCMHRRLNRKFMDESPNITIKEFRFPVRCRCIEESTPKQDIRQINFSTQRYKKSGMKREIIEYEIKN